MKKKNERATSICATVLISAAHKREYGTIVLVRCIQCRVVDMTLDAPKISYWMHQNTASLWPMFISPPWTWKSNLRNWEKSIEISEQAQQRTKRLSAGTKPWIPITCCRQIYKKAEMNINYWNIFYEREIAEKIAPSFFMRRIYFSPPPRSLSTGWPWWSATMICRPWFGCSTVCPILLGQQQIGQILQSSWARLWNFKNEVNKK